MTRQNLKSRFCAKFGCAESEYERRALSTCLYAHARWLGPILRVASPSIFEQDRKLICYLGEVTELRDAMREVGTFQDANIAHPRWGRMYLRFRASGRKAKALAETLFAEPSV